MTFTLTLQPDFALVLLAVAAIFLTNILIGAIHVGGARRKYKIQPPNLYATKGDYIVDGKLDGEAWKQGTAFNRAQRGHQQMIETLADAYLLLVLSGIFYPLYSARLAVLYVVGRIVYAVGYKITPSGRVVGELFYWPAYLGWLYGLYCAGTALYHGQHL